MSERTRKLAGLSPERLQGLIDALRSKVPAVVQPETLARTEERLKSLGLTVTRVSPFFDVDVPADLERLERELNAGRLQAPATAAALATLRRPER